MLRGQCSAWAAAADPDPEGRALVSLNACFSFLLSFSAPQVKKAFFALVANGVRAAPLWDTEKQSFVGKRWTHTRSRGGATP